MINTNKPNSYNKEPSNHLIIFILIAIIHPQLIICLSETSIILPLEIHNHVPYLQLEDLCESKPVFTKTQGEQIEKFEYEAKEDIFEEISPFYQNIFGLLLVDTGSTSFWLADTSCTACKSTQTLCPHLGKNDKRISYVKGFVEGVDTHGGICGKRVKFMCVRAEEGVGVEGDGVIGLGGEGNGSLILFKNIKDGKGRAKKAVEIESIKISIGKQISLMELTITTISISSFQISPPPSIPCSSSWKFPITSITILEIQITLPFQTSAAIDTGSSKIVLSKSMCLSFFEGAEKKGLNCKYVEGAGIDCNEIVEGEMIIKVNSDRELVVSSDGLIDEVTNRIQIICHKSEQEHNKQEEIILGYPFLLSNPTQFITTFVSPSQTPVFSIEVSKTFKYQSSYLVFQLMTLYICSVITVSFGIVCGISKWKNSREAHIVI